MNYNYLFGVCQTKEMVENNRWSNACFQLNRSRVHSGQRIRQMLRRNYARASFKFATIIDGH